MKVIVAGSRKFNGYKFLKKAINDSGFKITTIVSGNASGVDSLGEKYSREVLKKEPKLFPANWKVLGKSAGYIRNKAMAEYADALIAICVNNSRGTNHMINLAKSKGLKCYVVRLCISAKVEEFN